MTTQIKVPDIGGANQVDVIAVLVKAGDIIAIDTPLATLEGDKASMDIPSTEAGVVESVAIKVGDKVSEGSVICVVTGSESKAAPELTIKSVEATATTAKSELSSVEAAPQRVVETRVESSRSEDAASVAHASPAIRRLAHELDLDLSKIKGTGEKSLVTKDDIKNHLSKGSTGSGFSVLA
ncbi:MAG: E3 binding domain-containing protein, partial [Gammaproteobacteria bacterium]|nr:E3 binding domain-containing protein [Gammaproteobacteria bacterium]